MISRLSGITIVRAVPFGDLLTTELTVVLGSGFQVRLGDVGDLRLKLAIARRILVQTGAAAAAGYLDASVPERPVLSTNPQVGG